MILTDRDDVERTGWMHAAMGLPLPADASDEFVCGYRRFRATDGRPMDATVPELYSQIEGQMRADGILPDRRKPVSHDLRIARWLWIAVAFAVGRGWENIVGAAIALVGI